jgi:hypothetical protein
VAVAILEAAVVLARGEIMAWHTEPPKAQGSYLAIEKPWRHHVVAYYCPIMARAWSIHGRWYDEEAVEAWDYLPDLPSTPVDK